MASEINYNQLFEEINTALYIIQNGKIIKCNRLATKQSGWESVAIIGKKFLELFCVNQTEGRNNITQNMEAAQNGVGQIFEAAQLKADGQIFDVEINLTYTELFLVASIQDISERKKREALIEESEELYKKIVEESLSTAYLIQDGKVVYTNEKRHLEINKKYGKWIDGVIGKEAVSLVHPDDREMLREQVSNVIKGRRTAPYQYRLAMKDGDKNVWMMGIVSAILYKGKRAMLASAIDVTDLKESIRRVHELKALESSLLASMPQAVCGIVAQRIIFVNYGVENMFGWKPQELIGGTSRTFFRSNDEYEVIQRYLYEGKCLEGRKHLNMEIPFPLRRKNGSEVICKITGAMVDDSDGDKLVVVFEDITDKKMAQFQLQQSEKMASIGQLAAGVAHEINNPTAFVSSNLKTLSEYCNDIIKILQLSRDLAEKIRNEKVVQSDAINKIMEELDILGKNINVDFILNDIDSLIKESRDGIDRIMRIVRDLKNFAHPGDEKLTLIDINDNIESTLNIVWNELKYKAVVHKEYGEIPKTYCYPQQLNQVFMNILVNASQAIKEKGEIRISTRNDHAGNIEIIMQDNGIGIPKENIPKLFNPFFTTKEVGKGTGLGLHVAYSIIQKHQGKIEVESKPGVGTTFIIRIPAKCKIEADS